MTTMTLWGHSCVRLDSDGDALVIDPGAFSDTDHALAGARTILVTHEHLDHLATEEVAAAVREGARLWSTAAVVDAVATAGAPRDALHTVVAGDTVPAGPFEVDVLGEWHAQIHADVPRPANVGFQVGGVLHPGDALPVVGGGVDVLLVPVGGPWLKLGEAVDYVRAARPRHVVPIHDAHLNDRGLALALRLLGQLTDAELVVPGRGEPWDLDDSSAPTGRAGQEPGEGRT